MSTPATTLSADGTAQPRRRVPRWVWFVVVCVALGAMTSVGVAWGIAWIAPKSTEFSLDGWQQADYPDSSSILTRADVPSLHMERSVHLGWDEVHFRTNVYDDLAIDLYDLPIAPDRVSASKFLADPAIRAAVDRHLEALRPLPRYHASFSVRRAGWPWRCLACEDAAGAADVSPPYDTSPRGLNTSRQPSWYADMLQSKDRLEADRKAIFGPGWDWRLDETYHAIPVRGVLLPLFPLWPGLLANTAIYGGAWAVLIGMPILLRRWLRARRGGCPQCGYSREGLKVDAPCPECGRATPSAHDATPTAAAR